MQAEMTIKEGKKEGSQKRYYENGQIHTEEYFIADKLDGIYKGFHKNGILQTEITYKNGKKEGFSRIYYIAASFCPQ